VLAHVAVQRASLPNRAEGRGKLVVVTVTVSTCCIAVLPVLCQFPQEKLCCVPQFCNVPVAMPCSHLHPPQSATVRQLHAVHLRQQRVSRWHGCVCCLRVDVKTPLA
jgi:hypothetical protein